MAIFDKKTNKPIDSQKLARMVEEYNNKFLASQEQPKVDTTQPAVSTVKPITPPSQGNFDGGGFRIVLEQNQKFAKECIASFIASIDNQNVKDLILIDSDDDKPSPELVFAGTQYVNLTYDQIWNDSYSIDDMKYDVDKLSEHILEKDSMGLLSFMTGFPKYVTKNIRNSLLNSTLSKEDVEHLMAPIDWAQFAITEAIRERY